MLIDLVFKSLRTGKMLAKSIVRHQNLIFYKVSEHTVRPMKHWGFNKTKGFLSDLEFVTSLYGLNSFKVFSKMIN